MKGKEYDDYVAFLLSDYMRDYCFDWLDWTCDELWFNCVELAKRFNGSVYNLCNKSLYECVYEFIEDLEKEGKLYG